MWVNWDKQNIYPNTNFELKDYMLTKIYVQYIKNNF